MDTKCKTSSGSPNNKRWQIERLTGISQLKFVFIFLILYTVLGGQKIFAQGVGISETTIVPHASSILELQSSQRGFLTPRMTEAQRDAIAVDLTADGLIVYNTSTAQLNIYEASTSTWLILFSGTNSDIQAELDATQLGAGLQTDGTFILNVGTNYIDPATTLASADVLLDTQIKTNEDDIASEVTDRTNADAAIQTEVDAIETGAGLAANGDFVTNVGTNYINGATTLANADVLLDTQIKTNEDDIASSNTDISNLQTELDATQTGAGLAANGDFVTNVGTNYINGATTLANADVLLDTQIKTNEDDIASEVTNRTNADAAIQTEVDAIETGAGLAANGDFVTNVGTNYINGATTLANADVLLDTQIKTNEDDIASEVTDRTNADAAIQTEVDAIETGAGLAANGDFVTNVGTNYINGATTLANADVLLDAQIKTNEDDIASEVTDRTNADAAIQTEVDAIETGAGLAANGDFVTNVGTNYINGATTLANADVLLDTQIKTNEDDIASEVTDRTNADAAIQTEVDAIETGAGLAANGDFVTNVGTNYINGATTLANADVLLDAQIKTNEDDIASEVTDRTNADAAIQTELDAIETGAGLAANGDFVTNVGTNYINGATTLANADVLLDTQIKTNEDDIASSNTDISNLQTELDATQTGAGLAANGDFVTNVGTNYINGATTLANADVLLDTQIKTNEDDIASEVTDRTNADAAIQTEVDAIETGAGLAANGTFVTNVGTNYINGATTLANADVLLDAQIKTNEDDIASEVTDRTNADAAIQTEVDAIETGAGLAANGDFVTNVGTNYINGATTLANADILLDAQIKTNEDDIASEVTDRTNADAAIQTEVDAIETGAGLAANGDFVTNVGTNYINGATTLANADVLLDTQIKTNEDDIASSNTDISNLQTELDATQTGAGLAANGDFVTNVGTNYINGATTLANADVLLDTQIKTNEDDIASEVTDRTNADAAIQTEVDAIETGAGLAANGDFITNVGTNYINGATTLANADVLLDTQIKTNEDDIASSNTDISNLQTELDATQTGAGLAANGDFVTNVGTNYINGATTLANADVLLDTQIKTNEDDIASEVTDRTNADAAIQTEVDAIETGAGLAANGDFVTNVGTNYINGATTLANADVLLDTQIKTNEDDIASEVTDRTNADAAIQTEVDAIETGAGLAANGDFVTNVGTNYINGATTLANADVLLDTQIKTNEDDIASEVTDRTNADAAIQTEVDAIETGAGLAANGDFVTNVGTNYINGATTLANADVLLDTQIKTNEDDIASEVTDRTNADAAIQTEVDAIETGAGLAANGDFVTNVGTNYINGATTLANADVLLDTQIKTNEDDIASEVTDRTNADAAIQTEVDAIETGAGLAANGDFVTNVGTNYINGATTLANADVLLDAQIKTNEDDIASEVTDRTNADAAIQTEVDAIETGAGLAANGDFVTNVGTNYINGATTLANADVLLDAQIKTNEDDIASEVTDRTNADAAIQTEVDAIETGAGLAANGDFVTNVGTNYINGATTLANADVLLDTQIKTNEDDIASEVTDRTNADAAIQTEVDAIETGAGLAANGTFVTNVGTNYINGATTLANADVLLDAQIKTNEDDIASEVTDRTNADAAIQTEVDAIETGAGLAANGDFVTNVGTNYINGATTLANADVLLDAQIKTNEDDIASEVTDRTNADAAIQTEVDAIETGAGLAANGDFVTNVGTNYINGATTLANADILLDAQIKTNEDDIASEVTDRTNADAAIQTEVDAIETGAGLAANGDFVTNVGTNYINGATTLANADVLLDTQIKTNEDDIASEVTDRTNADAAIQTEVDAIETGAGLAANGDFVTNVGTNYINGATTLANADVLLDAQIKTNEDDIASEVTDRTNADAAIQTEVDAIETGAGLAANGDFVTNVGTNYINGATTLANADVLLDTQIKTNEDDIASEVTDRTNADAAIQTEVDAIETGAGLAANGDFVTNVGTNYINGATTLANADVLLDTQIKTNEDDIASEVTDRTNADAAIQTEVDAIETGAGLAANGDFVTNVGTNYINGATTLANADVLLDTQIKTNEDDIASSNTDISNLQTELDATQTGAGLAANGDFVTNVGTNYINGATTLANADVLLDTQIKTNEDDIASEVTDRTNADAAIQTEVDAIETGAGLAANGTFVTNVGTNYINGATTLANADVLLDTQIKTNEDDIASEVTDRTNADAAIQTEVDAIETGAGLAANGDFVTNVGTNYINGATTLANADVLLDTQIKTNEDDIASSNTDISNLQTELDATQTGAGLAANGDFVTNVGTNYINGATTLANADVLLDTQIKTNEDDIASEVTDRTNADAAIQTEVDAIETGAGLAANGDFVTNVGTNYINGATTLANADVLLDTQIKTNEDDIASSNTDISNLQTELDATQTGAGLSANGDFVTNVGTNYINGATTLANADILLDTQIKTNEDDIASEVTDRTNADASIQTEVDAIETGAGLAANGDFVTNVGTNYINGATTLANADVLLDTQIKTNEDDIASEVTDRTNADAAIQTEVDAIETGAGLAANGDFVTNVGTNYINGATTLANADVLLDTQIKTNEDDIASEVTDRTNADAAIQTEVDAIETGAGLAANGDFVTNVGTNYINGATTLANADVLLDTQIKTNEDDIASEVTDRTNADAAIQTEVDAIETGAGLAANGDFVTNVGTNYINGATTLASADVLLDTQIKTNEDDIASEVTDRTNADAAIQTEVDAIETGAGLAANGDFVTNVGTNYINGATTLANADVLLDTQIKTNEDDIASEVTDRTNADAAIQTEVDAIETGAGLAANGDFVTNVGTNYINGATTLANADVLLDAQIKTNEDDIASEVTDRTNADAAIQTEVDAIETGAGLAANGDFVTNVGTNYINGATTLANADVLLDAQIKTNEDDIASEVTDRTNADAAIQTEVDAIETGAGLAANGDFVTNVGTNYINGATTLANADVLLDTQIKTNEDDIASEVTDRTNADAAIQTEVDAIETGAGLAANGDFVTNVGTNYINGATTLANADVLLDTQIKTNEDDIASEVTDRTNADAAIQTEVDAIETGAGLAANGDFVTNVGTNYINGATTLANADVLLDTQIKTNEDDIASEVTDRTNADAAIQTEVDAIETGAGLAANGDFVTNVGTNYINGATTLANADVLLDAQIKTNEDDIASEVTDRTNADAAIQTEVDAIETGAGLAANGDFVTNVGTNYINGATTLANADVLLDTQIKTNKDDIASEVTDRTNADAAIQTEVDAIETGAGLAANGDFVTNVGTNYINGATTLASADVLLDTQIKTNEDDIASEVTDRTNADAAIQTEVDAIETGAGLAANGDFVTNVGTNYINGATTLANADVLLDTQIKTNEDDIASSNTDISNLQTELDATQTGAGLAANGDFVTNVGTNYINGATTLANADVLLDTQIKTNEDDIASEVTDRTNADAAIQTEVDAIETGAGLAANGDFVTNVGTNYINGATTLANADVLLDTQIKTNEDDIASEVTDRTNADAAIQTEVDAIETGAGLAANGDFVTNVGTNYINGATTLANADVLLDTQIKTNEDDIASSNTDISNLQTELDATQTGAGLAANGDFVTNVGTNYINGATTLANADVLLDTQIKTNEDDIASEVTDRTNADAAIQTEVDAIETGAGLAANGDFVTNVGTNYINGATTLANADVLLDTQIKTNEDDIASEVTDRTNADAAIQTEVDAIETGAGLAANGDFVTNVGTNYINGATTLANADVLLDTQIKTNEDDIASEVTDRTNADAAIQTEVDAIETGAGLAANGDFVTNVGTNYINGATTLANADVLLDAQIKTNEDDIASEVTDRTNADAAIQTEVDAIETGAGLAANGDFVTNVGTNYINGATTLANADVLLDTQIKTNEDDIASEVTDRTNADAAIQTEVDAIETGAGLAANGDFVTNVGTNYINGATTLANADVLLDAQIKTNEDDIASEVTDRTNADAAIQTEVDAIETGAGLAANGDFVTNVGTNYINGATTLANADVLLDAQIKTNEDDIASEVTDRTNADAAIQTEVDAIETGAGLAANGDFVTNVGTNYINGATTLANADVLLDTQIKTNEDDIASEVTDRTNADAAIQTEVDAIETGAGLAANGDFVTNVGTNYINGATTLANADVLLDTQIKTNEDDIASSNTDISNLQTELDATQTGAGLAANGDFVTNVGTNYINGATTLANADVLLDTQIKTNEDDIASEVTDRTNADAAIQTELDAIETGAGLAANGDFVTNVGTNYINGATTLANADVLLDAQIKTNEDDIASEVTDRTNADAAIQTEVDAIETGAGLAANGDFVTNVGTNYINGATTLANADVLLDTQIKTNEDDIASEVTDRTNADAAIQTEVDAIETGAGLAANGTFVTNVGTNYINGATTLASADVLLDTQIKTNEDDIALKAPIASPTFTGTVTIPSPFTLDATSVTTTGAQLNYLNAATGSTGTTTTNLVFSESPTLVTPTLGVATATSINDVTITAPATGATLTIADTKTLTVSDDANVSGTNTGDQTITLTGDVTGSGTGSFATTIANDAVTAAKIGTAGAGDANKLLTTDGSGNPVWDAKANYTATLATGKIFIGNGSNVATEQDMSGDATITNTGVLAIEDNAVTSAKINNATIINEDIANTTIDLTAKVTGTLPVTNGGTNSATALTNNQIMVSNGGAIKEAGVMTDGQVLVGSTGNAPVAATLTAGTGIDINNGAGTVTISNNIPVTQATGTADITTTSTTYVVATDMSIIPGAGDYLVFFTSSSKNSTNGFINNFSIFSNNVKVDASEITHVLSGNRTTPVSMVAYITNLGAGEAIDVRWKVSANTGTMVGGRTLIVQRVK